VAQIVDAQEPQVAGSRRRSLALASVAMVLVVFAATLDPVQRTARTAVGLAGLAPLAVMMSGKVTDEDGAPIAHAFVRVGQDGELATTYTDETGGYRLAFSMRTRIPAQVSVGATDFEASLRELRVASTDPQYDARLRPRVRIDAGATVHLVIASEDGLCYPVRIDSNDPDRSWPCRLLHVTVGRAGVLHVTVEGDDPQDRFGVSFAVGSEPTLLFATSCCAPDDTARLAEGADALVQIVALELGTAAAPSGPSRRGFTIRTALDPP
jgi:hypothetical protein